jgi:hypothetical protein
MKPAFLKQNAVIKDFSYSASPPARPAIVNFCGTDFATPIPEIPSDAISYNMDAELMVRALNSFE